MELRLKIANADFPRNPAVTIKNSFIRLPESKDLAGNVSS